MSAKNQLRFSQVPRILACLDRLGIQFKLDDFESRLVAQKVVYLLEQLGMKFGYRETYGYYIRGTYSPTLTKDLFDARPLGLLTARRPALTREDEVRLANLQEFVELRPHPLEVAAAYRYLTAERGLTPDKALRDIKTNKPFIPDKDIAVGISRCKRLFPQHTPEDAHQIEAEMEGWNSASNPEHL